MTKEEIIDNLELYTVGRPKKDQVSITVEKLQNLIDEIKALEQQPSDDCISRQAVLKKLQTEIDIESAYIQKELAKENPSGTVKDNGRLGRLQGLNWVKNVIQNLPPVTPTHCIATVRFSKEDLREICNERIEIECTHGTCKDCKHNYKISRNTFECSNGHRFELREPSTFYCADFEKRGDENESIN